MKEKRVNLYIELNWQRKRLNNLKKSSGIEISELKNRFIFIHAS